MTAQTGGTESMINWDGGGVEFLTTDSMLRSNIKDAAFGDPGSLAYVLNPDRLDSAIAESEHLVASIAAQLEMAGAYGRHDKQWGRPLSRSVPR